MYIAESAHVFPGDLTSTPTDLMPIPDYMMVSSSTSVDDQDSDDAMDGDRTSGGDSIFCYMSIIHSLYIHYTLIISGMELLSEWHQPEAQETD